MLRRYTYQGRSKFRKSGKGWGEVGRKAVGGGGGGGGGGREGKEGEMGRRERITF